MPLALVNSHDEPDRDVRRVDVYLTRTSVVAPTGRMPPSGTTIVWSTTLAATGLAVDERPM